MADLILHHYDISPYSEKIRLIFGLKGLPWRSVQIPIVMPKPDLTELTGGYRRTPVLQIGADVYCDTRLIARVVDHLHPDPPLLPRGAEGLANGLARWGESTFMMVVTALWGSGFFDESFLEDRKSMIPPGADASKAKLLVPSKLLQIRANLDWLEWQLGDGRPFLLGEAPSLADFAAYHPIMFLGVSDATRPLLSNVKHLPAWMQRVAGIGHGQRTELGAKDAVAIARDATPAEPTLGAESVLPDGFQLGDPVVVLPEEQGSGAVSGALAASGLHEIVVRRRSERAGEVAVHFPREEYLVVRAG